MGNGMVYCVRRGFQGTTLRDGGTGILMKEPINEPLLSNVICEDCYHKWTGFFPDVVKDTFGIECPECKRKSGALLLIPYHKKEKRK